MLEVNLSGSMRDAANGATSVNVEAATIRELLRKMAERYPRMSDEIERGIAVSINGRIFRDSWSEEIPTGAEVFLLPRLEGG